MVQVRRLSCLSRILCSQPPHQKTFIGGVRSISDSMKHQNAYPFFAPERTTSLPESQFVKFHSKGPVRIVELTRPSALHALNLEMIESITMALQSWEKSSNCKMVVLKSDNSTTKSRSFCAGGDVLAIMKEPKLAKQSVFFKKEYALNHLIGTYSKPILSLLDGITMGGGVGISIHGQYRIATENTVFAMPETAIGFFPDVGGSFFLPRLEGALGMYLGLTGARLKGIDTYHAGISTHYVPSTRVEDFLESLCLSNLALESLPAYIEQFSAEYEPYSLSSIMKNINQCFSAPSLGDIFKRLKLINNEWSMETLETIKKMSPTALAVTFELYHRGSDSSFKTCFRTEYNLAKNFLEKVPDLPEGIEAKLVKKLKSAKWNPESIDLVTKEQIQSLFSSNTKLLDELEFHNNIDFEDYPHRDLALPTFEQIKQLVNRNRSRSSWREILDQYCIDHHHKLGLREKIESIMSKHVKTREDLEKDNRIAVSGLNWTD